MEKALAVMDYSRYEVQRFDGETIETEDVLLRILSRCKYLNVSAVRFMAPIPWRKTGIPSIPYYVWGEMPC